MNIRHHGNLTQVTVMSALLENNTFSQCKNKQTNLFSTKVPKPRRREDPNTIVVNAEVGVYIIKRRTMLGAGKAGRLG